MPTPTPEALTQGRAVATLCVHGAKIHPDVGEPYNTACPACIARALTDLAREIELLQRLLSTMTPTEAYNVTFSALEKAEAKLTEQAKQIEGLKKLATLDAETMTAYQQEIERLKADLQVAHDIGDSFWAAIKPLNLRRINVSNPGAHVTELIQEIKRLRDRTEEQASELLTLREESERPKCAYCSFGETTKETHEALVKHIEHECQRHPIRLIERATWEAADLWTRHDEDCAALTAGKACTCGLDAARAAAQGGGTKE